MVVNLSLLKLKSITMKTIQQHQIETLKNILEKLTEIEKVYEFNKRNLDINFPFVVGRAVGLSMVSAVELKVLIENLENEKDQQISRKIETTL